MPKQNTSPPRIPVYKPYLSGKEKEYVNEAIDSGWINKGPFIERFEEELAFQHGVGYAVACSSGTAALHLALLAAGVGPGDSVVVPSLTCVMTANAVRYCGADVKLVDVNIADWTILVGESKPIILFHPAHVNPKHLQNIKPGSVVPVVGDIDKSIKFIQPDHTFDAKAIIPVHLYGARARTDFPIFTIVDSAQAVGMDFVLGDADIATFSFSGNKTITTGQGGACLTNNRSLAERMRFFRQQAQYNEGDYWHTEIGYNYRMTNIQAAIGLAQLENIEEILEKKRFVDCFYRDRLNNSGVHFQEIANDITPWATVVKVPDAVRTINVLRNNNIETRPSFFPLHMLPMYDGVCPNAKQIYRELVMLPSYPELTKEELERICQTLLLAL